MPPEVMGCGGTETDSFTNCQTVHLRTYLFSYLFAVETLLGKLLVVTARAVNVLTFSQEALRANWLLTVKAGETVFMPDFILVFHALGSWTNISGQFVYCASATQIMREEATLTRHHHFVTTLATVSILTSATFATHNFPIIPCAKWLTGQRFVALSAAETVLVPVTVLVVQLLGENKEITVVYFIHFYRIFIIFFLLLMIEKK